MAARVHNVFSLAEILIVVSEKKMKMWNSHRVLC
jgi:hypothetical protein